ncbi:LppU/SCO3897 family protein [Phytohabitans rumicis]|nr:hypothetical protein [Phytohabitans rumicis]
MFPTPQGQPGYPPYDGPTGYPPHDGPPGFPPQGPPQGGPAPWGPPPGADQEQNKFNAFQPEAAPAKPESEPVPQVRNGRVLIMVLAAAALLLIVPLGIVWLLTRGSDPSFNPEVGSCVKQSGTTGAVAAQCTEANAFKVVSKVDEAKQCTDQSQPHVVIAGDGGKDQVLCLAPAASG